MESSGESSGVKRSVDEVESARAGEPAPARPRIEEALSVVECNQLCDSLQNEPHEVFMAEFLKKKMSKELPHSKNPPLLQAKVDEGKRNGMGNQKSCADQS